MKLRFKFKKKIYYYFFYPDNGSIRIFSNRIIIRIKTGSIRIKKKKNIRVQPDGPGYGSKHYAAQAVSLPVFYIFFFVLYLIFLFFFSFRSSIQSYGRLHVWLFPFIFFFFNFSSYIM